MPADKQARFREINEKLSALTLKFGNNVLGATNNYALFVDNEDDLKGLTEGQLAAAKEAAADMKDAKGKYAFTVHIPSMEPFLQNCENRELRKELWTAYSNRCLNGEFNNKEIINEIVNLRLEKAKILGFDNYAIHRAKSAGLRFSSCPSKVRVLASSSSSLRPDSLP